MVEDDEAIRESLCLALEIEGYAVFAAADGRQGIERLASIPRPCVILLDLMMPIMNGWQFLEALHTDELLATVPVVVVTAFSNRTAGIKANGILKKPIDLNRLLEIVREHCGPP